ncbi:DHS-like NAD/FAD-binding domain-containing protein [Gigaspora margarita]|uniref:DHS-like NAD/FAD-binding domain-containing protein n=1 Tax=Gigaspora margarita TaxID=4874 RepID=A0A8H4ET58_GIGMA|nr:DHS-like NAD/FAD-binding domain-containing protein [Gigaspora margarita]
MHYRLYKYINGTQLPGISCSGGIPDFKSSNGLFEMINQKYLGSFRSVRDLFDANLHISDKAVKAFYNFMEYIHKNIDYLEEKAEIEVWNFKNFKRCKPQVVQLHGILANLQCKLCANVYSFTQEYCDIFTKGEVSNCPECKKRVILYGDKHPNEFAIGEIAAFVQDKVDCLIIMGTSLKIPVTKEWNGVIDYQIVGNCDDWIELIDKELSNVKP